MALRMSRNSSRGTATSAIWKTTCREAGNLHLLDIKALVDGKKLPVKILVSSDKYSPVKAIGEDGAVYDIKVITLEGEKLDVKGVSRSGSIIHIKMIGPHGA